MSKFVIPYTFVGGTKAKAEEVNANFAAVKDELTSKAYKNGSSGNTFEVANATSINEAVNKGQLDEAVSDLNSAIDSTSDKFAPNDGFKVVLGNINTDKEPDLLDITDNTKVCFKIGDNTTYPPLEAILGNGEKFKLESLTDISTTTFSNGINNLFVNKDGEVCAYTNKIFKQKTQPKTYVETSWTQPTLSSAGTLGGDSFACSSRWLYNGAVASDQNPYLLLNGNAATPQPFANGVLTNVSFVFYNPVPLKISTLTIKNNSAGGFSPNNQQLFGSNDGTNWTLVKNFVSPNTGQGATYTVSINSNSAYKYHKYNVVDSATGANWLGIHTFKITATQVIEGVKVNDIWVDTTKKPYIVTKYNGIEFEEFNYVPLPQTVSVTDGLATTLTLMSSYGVNGIEETLSLPDYDNETLLTNGSTFIAPFTGWIKNISTGAMYVIIQGDSLTPTNSNLRYYPIKGA